MMPIVLAFLFLAQCCAQDVTTLLTEITLLNNPPTTVLTVKATQGDGTICQAAKEPGSTVFLVLTCTSGGTTVKGAVLQSTDTIVSGTTFGYGDVLCLLRVNPTATAQPAIGAFPALPAVSVAWQCSTNIRTAGAVSGQTALVSGSVSWP